MGSPCPTRCGTTGPPTSRHTSAPAPRRPTRATYRPVRTRPRRWRRKAVSACRTSVCIEEWSMNGWTARHKEAGFGRATSDPLALEPAGDDGEQEVRSKRRERGGPIARRRRAEEHDRLDREHHHAEQRHAVAAEAGRRCGRPQIKEHAAEQCRDLEQERGGRVVPETETDLGRVVVEWQIGT